jgi:hypothetical protein
MWGATMGVNGKDWNGGSGGCILCCENAREDDDGRNTKRMVQISGTGVETKETNSEI